MVDVTVLDVIVLHVIVFAALLERPEGPVSKMSQPVEKGPISERKVSSSARSFPLLCGSPSWSALLIRPPGKAT
jgi:hypothetical protein